MCRTEVYGSVPRETKTGHIRCVSKGAAAVCLLVSDRVQGEAIFFCFITFSLHFQMLRLDMSASAVTRPKKKKSIPRDEHHRSVHNCEDRSIFKPNQSSSTQMACVTTSAPNTATSTQHVDASLLVFNGGQTLLDDLVLCGTLIFFHFFYIIVLYH